MASISTLSREEAASRARCWLQGLSPATNEAKALRRLGLLCCERIRSGIEVCGRGSATPVRLPRPAVFVTMGRARAVALCRSISLASRRARRLAATKRESWSELFGSVALSYARVGDASTTAALLRVSAQLGLTHPWLGDAERFLLDQQTPEGSFGLFARELALLGTGGPPWSAHLDLSVEVLWALAEVAALRQGSRPSVHQLPTARPWS
jgi:hypothetical protein